MKTRYKVHIVNKRRVVILQRYTNTYLVKFVKNGKTASVCKRYVRAFYVQRRINRKEQLSLNL